MKDTSNKLENLNKNYHDMHATFVSKRWENKHYLSGMQDTVSKAFKNFFAFKSLLTY